MKKDHTNWEKKDTPVLIRGGIVFVLIWLVIILGVVYWWNHNRMDYLNCFFNDSMGEFYIRWTVLTQHTPGGQCGALDEEKHWLLVEKASKEWDWEEAHLLLAVKHGYGGYFNRAVPSDLYNYSYRTRPDINPDEIEINKQNMFALSEDFGDGKNLDYEESLRLLKKSAEQNYELAQNYLSHVYYVGKWGKDYTVEQDINNAMYWLEKAANDKTRTQYCNASFYAGYYYRYGVKDRLKADDTKAYNYFSKIENKQYIDSIFCIQSMVELARMYAEGRGVEKNEQQAMEWLNKALQVVENPAYGKEKVRQYVITNKKDIENYSD